MTQSKQLSADLQKTFRGVLGKQPRPKNTNGWFLTQSNTHPQEQTVNMSTGLFQINSLSPRQKSLVIKVLPTAYIKAT